MANQVDVREHLLKESIPSRISFFITLSRIAGPDGIIHFQDDGKINSSHSFESLLEGLKQSCKDFLNMVSILSGLF